MLVNNILQGYAFSLIKSRGVEPARLLLVFHDKNWNKKLPEPFW